MGRTKNAVRNIKWGGVNKIISMIFQFLIRTIIIQKFGSEYLGLNSLFISILQILNITEIGFSSAVVFSMYEPIAKDDKKTICALLNLYRKIYRIVGLVILIIGIAVMPFLQNLIKGSYPQEINIYVLYVIFLANTVLTYFLFSYKNTLLTAHQRSDIVSNVSSLSLTIQYLVQIIIICVFKNYYAYAVVQIFGTAFNNLYCAYIVNKKYPEYKPKGKISKSITKDIEKKVAGLLIQRICVTTRNSLDSIFISAYIGLSMVAVYNNYYTVMNAIVGIMGIITNAITAGIGNSLVVETEDKNYKDFRKFDFIYMWMSGWCTVCLMCLYQPFMKVWMGENLMLDIWMVMLFCIYFYVLKVGVIRTTYANAKGLWWENRYRAIIESVLNLVLNWILINFMGIYGVILGTIISIVVVNLGYGTQILYKEYFKTKKITDFFKSHISYLIVTIIATSVTFGICYLIPLEGILGIAVKLVICLIIPNIIYFVIYRNTKVYGEAKKFVTKNILKR